MGTAYEGWAIVELMGHRRHAGRVSETEMYGVKVLRIDIPSDPPATMIYGGAALYCMTPTTEETARRIAQGAPPAPVHVWEFPKLPAGPSASSTPPSSFLSFHDDDDPPADDPIDPE